MVNTIAGKHKTSGLTLTHEYTPRGGCKTVFDSREEEVLVSGPAGTGKSRACLEKLFMVCLSTPNVRALILRKTAASLASSALVTWRNYVAKEAIATGTVVYYGGSKEEPAQYRFSNGSSVTIGGLDKSTRIMSTEYDIIYVQEATEITLDDLEMIKTRLRNWVVSFQQLIMDCNPAGDQHWLKLRCNEGTCKLIESRHEDNPRLFADDGMLTPKGEKYISILDKLTGVRYKRLRLGLWVSSDGIVYEEFDPAYHVLSWEFDETTGERLPLPEDWPRYWVIDFGFVNPFVWQCWAQDPETETLYMYREIYYTQRTVEEHAQQIMDIVTPETSMTYYDHLNRTKRTVTERKWIEPEPTMIICDHDAEGRRTFERHTGLGTKPAIKNVFEGINVVKEKLQHKPGQDAQVYLMADALVERDPTLVNKALPTCTQEEFPSYVWQVSTDGRIQDNPVKRDDHGLDTTRYIVTELYWRGKPRYTELDV